MPKRSRLHLGVTILLAGCAGAKDAGDTMAKLGIEVAPLDLPDLAMACFDLSVSNASGVVWRRGDPTRTRGGLDQTDRQTPASEDDATICSDRFGNGPGGDISYIGPCDAMSDSDPDRAGVQNDVTLHVDGLYRAGPNLVDSGDWRDPCPSGCVLSASCVENADTRVTFDLTVMRDARQGFIDIALDLEDVFCSAKLDTCYEGDTPIRLLHGADETRDWTAVFGFACTGGVGSGAELHLGAATVTCGLDVFQLDVSAAGNQSVTSGGDTLHYGVYRGAESLLCQGAPCEKLFWNLAVSLDDLASFGGDCLFEVAGTVAPPDLFVGGVLAADHMAYPYVEVSAALTDDGVALCQRHALDDGGAVQTHYRGDLGGLTDGEVLCSVFDGVSVTATDGAGCPGAPCPAPNGPFSVELSAVDQNGQPIATIGGEVRGPDLVWSSGPLALAASFAANTGTTMTLASRFGGREREVTLELRPRQVVRVDVHTGAITTECAESARVIFVHTTVEVVMDARSFQDEALPPVPWHENPEPAAAECLDTHGTGSWRPVPFSVWRAAGAQIGVECRWAWIDHNFAGLTAKGTLTVSEGSTTWIDPRVQVIQGTPDEFPIAALEVSPTPGTTRIVAGFEPITVYFVPEDLSGLSLPSDGTGTLRGSVYDYYAPSTPRWFYDRGPHAPLPAAVPLPDGGIIAYDLEWGGLERAGALRVWKNSPVTIYAEPSTGTNISSTPGALDDPNRTVSIHVRYQPIAVTVRAVDSEGAPVPVEFQDLYNNAPEPLPFVTTPLTYPHRARGGRTVFRYRIGEVETPLSINPIDVDTTYTNVAPSSDFTTTPSPGLTEVIFVF